MSDFPIGRRELIAGAALAAASGCAVPAAQTAAPLKPFSDQPMFGLIGRMRAVPGQRDRLIYLLLKGSANMPGCLSYVVAADPSDPDAIWVTEAWEDESYHKASLRLPDVRDAIAQAKPLIAGFDDSHTVLPVGGPGLRGCA